VRRIGEKNHTNAMFLGFGADFRDYVVQVVSKMVGDIQPARKRPSTRP
jgi:hypothetical protein